MRAQRQRNHHAQYANRIQRRAQRAGYNAGIELEAQNLVEWDDFINRLRGVNAVPTRIAGSVKFRGRILGPIAGPTFSGHIRAADARYDGYQWDEIYGDLDYSLDDFKLSKAVVRRGQASFNLDLSMQLDGDWSFVPQSVWSLAVQTAHAPSDDVQAMLGTSYPFTAAISATLNGSGTNAAPVLNGNFTLENIQTKGLHFDRLGGALHFARDEVRLSHAELGRDAGRVTGDILYRPQEENIEFDLTGAGIQLDKIQALQNTSLPLAGRLDFALRGGGPVRAPAGKGDFHVLNLKIGADEEGDFHGQLDSDGHNVRVALDSQGSHGQLKGELSVGLSGDEDISGKTFSGAVRSGSAVYGRLASQELDGAQRGGRKFHAGGSAAQTGFDRGERGHLADLVELPIHFAAERRAGTIHLSPERNSHRAGSFARPRHGFSDQWLGAV